MSIIRKAVELLTGVAPSVEPEAIPTEPKKVEAEKTETPEVVNTAKSFRAAKRERRREHRSGKLKNQKKREARAEAIKQIEPGMSWAVARFILSDAGVSKRKANQIIKSLKRRVA